MPTTFVQAHAQLNQQAQAVFAGTLLVFGNIVEESYWAGTQLFVKFEVKFRRSGALGLGSQGSQRRHGTVTVTIHSPKGSGDGGRNQVLETVVTSFADRRIGGAVLRTAQAPLHGETSNWSLSSIEVPFHFDSL